ncbi:Cytochrome P450 monooxygenase [Cladobotryum mycophilum]|uniref:Cytochrome P450 monooxygenase n=1 Tax=Cladobotryum mycophilum TaxID=491253 RepID=A0ABR0S5A7_9HYPO
MEQTFLSIVGMIPIWAWALGIALIGLLPMLYNMLFHPLRHFPGPSMAGATLWWKAYKEVFLHQTLATELFDLHEKHGDIVRVGPNELHFGNPSAFHEIYNGSRRWDKDVGLYGTPGVRSGSFVTLKYDQAKERRAVLQPMFSKRAIKNIEGLVWKNADRLSAAITRGNAEDKSVDFLYAFRSFTLDTIMGFTLGDCINAVDAPSFADPLILAMDASLRALPLLKNFPLIRKLAYAIPPSLMMKTLPDPERLTPRIYQVRSLIQERLKAVIESPEKLDEAAHQTVFHRMLDKASYKSKVVPESGELHDEGLTLIFAGANTVADTLLMGHWHLLNQPKLLDQLRAELTTVWPDPNAHPSVQDLESLPLLTATIKESLRHIPSGVSLTRIVPPEGATISGRRIPGGTIVGMSILHVHQSEQIFKDALAFKPERWLVDDTKHLDEYLVAFSRGPRMCFGVNLAWCELYVAFATMIRRFDMALDKTTAEDMEWRECIAAYYPKRHLHAWCRPVEK